MSQSLTDLLANAAEGSPITCTLSADSVQVIFYALSFLMNVNAWQEDYFDQVTESEWTTITELLEGVTEDILP